MNPIVNWSIWVKKFWIWLSPWFSMPFQSLEDVLRDPVLGSLSGGCGWGCWSRLPKSKHNGTSVRSLYLLEKMVNKTNPFCQYILFQNQFFFATGVRVKFSLGRLRNNLWSSTWTHCFKSFERNLQYFKWRQGRLHVLCRWDVCQRNGKLDTKWSSRQTKSMDGNFVT